MSFVLVFLSVLFSAFTNEVAANQIINVHVTASSSVLDRGKAVKEMTDKAINEITEKYVVSLIGTEKFLKNKNLLKTKIVHNSSRYVLLIKNGTVKRKGDEYQMFFDMKVSLLNLKEMLLREGLLYKEDGPPSVLPLITITDKVGGQTFSWWTQPASPSTSYVRGLLTILHQQLGAELYGRGFYGFSPVKFSMQKLIPQIFQNTGLRREDYLNMGYILGGSVVVLGNVKISKIHNMVDTYEIGIDLEAVHSTSGRVVGEVIRSYQTTIGPYKDVVKKKVFLEVSKFARDLTVQLKDAWKKGVFDASLLKVSFSGKRLSYRETEELKKTIVSFGFIKSLRERFIGDKLIEFEMDSNLSVAELAKVLVGKKILGYKVKIDGFSGDGLQLAFH